MKFSILLCSNISSLLCSNISRSLGSENSRCWATKFQNFCAITFQDYCTVKIQDCWTATLQNLCAVTFSRLLCTEKNISLHNRLLWSGSTILRLLCSKVSKLLCSDFWEYCAVTVPSLATPRDRMGGARTPPLKFRPYWDLSKTFEHFCWYRGGGGTMLWLYLLPSI